ncbi:hypothetical protein ACO1O0_000138 [Amphichorda felina]
MRVLSSLFFASGALAAAVARQEDPKSADYDCFLANRREMAADAGCGDHMALSLCFSKLTDSDPFAIAECYNTAGCGAGQAASKAASAQDRCADLFPGDAELRRRRRHIADEPSAPLTAPPAFGTADIFPGHDGLFARGPITGDDCFTTKTTKTEVCDMETVDGKTNTVSCSSTEVPVSECASGKTCSMDKQGTNICMDLKDSLDVAGIIISIVFGVAIVLGVASLTFFCCRDRKEQKRMAIKAEATALKRAATKKKRAEAREQRAPLMREERRRDASAGSTDPFHDQNRP